jgi:hypothetical protein
MFIGARPSRGARVLLLGCIASFLVASCGDEAVGPGEQPGPVSQSNSLAIISAPWHTKLGLPLPVKPIVELRDVTGRPVLTPGIAITASISTGQLSGATTVVTNAQGRAIFTDLSIDSISGKTELRFSCCGLAPATRTLSLSLGSASISRLEPEVVKRIAGLTLSPGPRVLLRDEREKPRAGTTVRFEFDNTAALPAVSVSTDTNGVAALPTFQFPDLPSSTQLRAVDVATGKSVSYILTAITQGAAYLRRPTTTVGVGDVVTLPRVAVYDDATDPIAGALVRYRIASGDGTLSTAEVHTDADGLTEPVTFSTGSRGQTSIEIVAVGYSSEPIAASVFAFVPPLNFEYAGSCDPGCPASLNFSWPVNGDPVWGMDVHLWVRVRDATGVIPEYVVNLVGDPGALLLMEDDSGFDYYPPLSESEPLVTNADGIARLIWRLPRVAGTYHFTMSGPSIDTPWTYTATVE